MNVISVSQSYWKYFFSYVQQSNLQLSQTYSELDRRGMGKYTRMNETLIIVIIIASDD